MAQKYLKPIKINEYMNSQHGGLMPVISTLGLERVRLDHPKLKDRRDYIQSETVSQKIKYINQITYFACVGAI